MSSRQGEQVWIFFIKQTFTIRFIICIDYDSRNVLRTLDLAVPIFTTLASTTNTSSTTMNTSFVANDVALAATRIRSAYTGDPYVTADRCIFTGIIGRNNYDRRQITIA